MEKQFEYKSAAASASASTFHPKDTQVAAHTQQPVVVVVVHASPSSSAAPPPSAAATASSGGAVVVSAAGSAQPSPTHGFSATERALISQFLEDSKTQLTVYGLVCRGAGCAAWIVIAFLGLLFVLICVCVLCVVCGAVRDACSVARA
jgi:hypothetical protein